MHNQGILKSDVSWETTVIYMTLSSTLSSTSHFCQGAKASGSKQNSTCFAYVQTAMESKLFGSKSSQLTLIGLIQMKKKKCNQII